MREIAGLLCIVFAIVVLVIMTQRSRKIDEEIARQKREYRDNKIV